MAFLRNSVNEDITLNFNINFYSDYKDKIDTHFKDQKKMYISFGHEGELPAPSIIRIYVGNKFTKKDEINLYSYNINEDKLEVLTQDLSVSGGYIEFEIDSCTNLVLSEDISNNNKEGKNMNYVIIIMITGVIILIAISLFTEKKDK